jgi:uncharacterized protein
MASGKSKDQPDSEQPLLRQTGIGLRPPHHAALLELRPASVGWLEIHAETYMGGGAARHYLEQLRAIWPVSVHGTGLGLGSAELPDAAHLERLAALVERTEPALVSEHLAWSSIGGFHFNDLLPLPYTTESLDLVCRNIDVVQTRLKRPILIETPSTYLRFRDSQIAEAEYLSRLAARTGCGILCDVNNIYISSVNHLGVEAAPAVAEAYLDSLPPTAVHEIHIGGHTETQMDGRPILLDDHGALVAAPVWRLYASAVQRFPHAATLLEWDSNLPPLPHLLAEAEQADRRRAEALATSDDDRNDADRSSDDRAA